MFIKYQWCREYRTELEQYPAGYVIAYDYDDPTELDYDIEYCNESLWLIPSGNSAT